MAGGDVVLRFSKWLTILAILNLYAAPMPPQVLAQSDLWFGRRCRLKNFKMATMAISSWISERNDFSKSESLCHYMPPIKFQLSLRVWEEMLFEEFQDGRHGGHLGYWNGKILAIPNQGSS